MLLGNQTSEFDRLRFAKQFIIGEGPLPAVVYLDFFEYWCESWFGGRYRVRYHPDLQLCHGYSVGAEILCMGVLLDPDSPERTNSEITQNLAITVNDFDQLEARLARFAGRWVILAKFGDKSYIYHDAGGLKTVFLLAADNNGTPCVASQPSLLARVFKLPRRTERDVEIKCSGLAQWPPYICPYDGMTQLLPNHRLNLNNYNIERYWPPASLAPLDLEEAASELLGGLRAVVQASVKRKSCYMSVSGGYDSRVTVASSVQVRDQISYFTMRHSWTPGYDLAIAKKIARVLKLNHGIVEHMPTNPGLLEVLRENSSHMFGDRSGAGIGTLTTAVPEGAFYLPGAQGELLRCHYYNDGESSPLDANQLCQQTDIATGALGLQGFQKWLATLPEETTIEPLDLVYWECRTGVWAGASGAFREALMEVVPPLNNRHILEIALRVANKHRQTPHLLCRQIYGLVDAELLKIGFSTTKRYELQQYLSKLPILWRLGRLM